MSNVPCFEVEGDESAVSVSYQLGEFCVNFSKSSSGQSPEIELKRNHSNTKTDCCYAAYKLEVNPGGHDIIEWELLPVGKHSYLDNSSNVIQEWKIKAETFYNSLYDCQWSDQEKTVAKGAWAGLLWNKQFYYYDVDEWYHRGQATEKKVKSVKPGNWDVMERNIKWRKHFKAKDILSVPDKWEFPWFATWDTCFQMIPLCRLDSDFAKHQLLLLLSERYMSPEGQLPGCEFNFDDNNPPIHAWTSLKVFQMTGGTDLNFLFSSYCKLHKNYNWWMTNLQCRDRYIFHGGFLGLDNISVVDRGCPPEGYTIKQADATTWMALFAISMVQIGIELIRHNFPSPGDIQKDLVKYLNDFLCISKQLNKDIFNGGMWNPEMTFYNDVLVDQLTEQYIPIQVRSLVGLLPLVACGTVNFSGIRCTEELKQVLQTDSIHVLQTDSIHVCVVIIVRSLVGLLPLIACGTVNFSGIRCTEELKQVLQTDSIHVCGVIIVRSLVGLLPLVACGTVNFSGIRCTEELKQVLQTDSIHVCGVIIVRSLVGLLPLVACGTVNFSGIVGLLPLVACGTVNLSGIRCTEELKQVLQTDSIHVCGVIIVRLLVGLLPLIACGTVHFSACGTVNFSGIRCTEELKQVLQTDSIHVCGVIIVRSLVGLLPLVACGTVNFSGIRCTEELKQVLQTDSIHACGVIIVRSSVGLLPFIAFVTVHFSGIRCTEELKQITCWVTPLLACGTVNFSGFRCTEELKQVLQTDSIHVCVVIIVRSLVGLLPLIACGTVNFSGIRCTEELKQVLQTDSIHVCGVIIVRSLVGLLPLVACGTVNFNGFRCTEELKQVLQTDSIHVLQTDSIRVCGVIKVRSLVGLLPLVACGTVNFSGMRCTEELKQVLQTDSIHVCGVIIVRSLVGLLPLVACGTVHFSGIRCTEELKQVLQTDSIHIMKQSEEDTYFLTCVPPERITNLLEVLFDEDEFLSNFGIRSLSKIHSKDYILTLPVRKKTTENPETFSLTENFTLHYAPGEADSEMMGGNSNWRGPIWICANYILLDAIEKIHSGLGSRLTIQYPAHKSKISLDLAVKDVCKRLVSMFLPDSSGARPLHGDYKQFTEDSWKDLILYYEYFHADSGRGCGASHQTGWTALITEILYTLYS
ncbi:unnamed protein product [Mytilus edulis]|uniref:Mannosylglycerate hydrolase MGH1-like glycoside hydrolase domain-containing protein n=1 Tax=Mytilus edulis TaxID=6550 RepID=A0A8S3PXT1_MYTED|nr:unnamed protein product [Mytilus edulis]